MEFVQERKVAVAHSSWISITDQVSLLLVALISEYNIRFALYCISSFSITKSTDSFGMFHVVLAYCSWHKGEIHKRMYSL